MQLEVEEDLLAGRGQFGNERKPAAVGELHANLIERRALADPLDETSRPADIGPRRARQSIDRAARER